MNPEQTPPANTPTQTSPSWHARLTSKWGLVSLVVLAVLLFGAAYLLARQEEPIIQPPASQPSPQTALVTITSSGFSPATVSVAAGTQVTWTNNDTAPHQVAADPHPLHSSIPNFDSDQLLQPGDSFSFVFETPGTYTYHDQLNPLKLLGTVVVE